MRNVKKLRYLCREQRGQAMPEFAFTAVVILTLLFGIMELGRAMYVDHFISTAAQNATRYAIVRGSSWAGTTPGGSCKSSTTGFDCWASATDIKNYITSNVPPGISTDTTILTVTPTFCGNVNSPNPGCTAWSDSTASASGVDCTANSTTALQDNPGCLIQVTVTYKFNFLVGLFPKSSLTFTATSEQIIQQ